MKTRFRQLVAVMGTVVLLAGAARAQGTEDRPVTAHLGPDIGLSVYVFENAVSSTIPQLNPKIEVGMWIAGRVDLYFAIGFLAMRYHEESDAIEENVSAGAIDLELGARFLFTRPEPGKAVFYLGLAAVPVIPIYSEEAIEKETGEPVPGENELDARERERIDRFDVAVFLGLEYLVSANFGIGVEAGLTTSFNNLIDTNDPDSETDSELRVAFSLPILFRFAYHF